MALNYNFVRVASDDKYSYDDYSGKVPYCVVNADRYCLSNTKLENVLQSITEESRASSDKDSLEEFINLLDVNKLLWRPPIGIESIRKYGTNKVKLLSKSQARLKNTGLESLLVGEPFYMMPAISSFAHVNPSLNIFSYKGKTYVHPMVIGHNHKVRIENDLLILTDPDCKQKDVQTFIGSVIKRHILGNTENVLKLDKLLLYMKGMRAVGYVVIGVEGYRPQFEYAEHHVPIGSDFLCNFNLF